MRKRNRSGMLVAGLVLALLVGCNAAEVETYPVRGKVAFPDGRPLTTGWVYTRPDPQGPEKRVYTAKGPIKPDGTFVLSTLGEGDGAIAGKHGVIIDVPTARELWDDDDEVDPATKKAHPEIAQSFRVYGTSGLEMTVAADRAVQEVEFVVKSK